MRKHFFSFLLLTAGLLMSTSAWADIVAKIGDNEYATLAAAVSAASSGAEIQLIADIHESVTVSKTLTIDLNGHFWYPATIGTALGNGSRQLTINAAGDVTLKDGNTSVSHKYEPDEDNDDVWVLNDNATGTEDTHYFKLAGGAIIGARYHKNGAICVLGKLTIESGNIVGNSMMEKGSGVEYYGGGVSVGNEATHGTLVIKGGNVCGNRASGGGGIGTIHGDITMIAGNISYNKTIGEDQQTNGGGICVGTATVSNGTRVETCKLIISGGSINHNTSAAGGAIYYSTKNYTGNEDKECFEISGTADISNNTARFEAGATIETSKLNYTGNGGAIYVSGLSLQLKGGTLDHNVAARDGGAILGPVVMSGGTISNCSATVGGAIYTQGSNSTMTGGTITNCYVNGGKSGTNYGGGVYMTTGKFTMSGGIIQNCTSYGTSGIGGGIWSCGELEINDGAVIKDNVAKGTNMSSYKNGGANVFVNAADNNGTTKLTINGGSITGGTIDADYGAANGVYIRNEHGAPRVNINGGTIGDIYISGSASDYGLWTGSEIKGGKIASVTTVDANAKNFISGGVYTTAPVDQLIVTGKTAVENKDAATSADYPYAIGDPVISIVVYPGEDNPGKTPETLSKDEWETKLTTQPNAVAVIEYSAAAQDFAESTNNIIVHSTDAEDHDVYTCPKLVLQDTPGNKEYRDFYAPVDFTATGGSYSRNLSSNYNTCCLPFILKHDMVNDDNSKFLIFYGYKVENNQKIAIFSDFSDLTAPNPCLIYCSKAATLSVTFNNTSIKKDIDNMHNIKGTYTKESSWAGISNMYSLVADGSHFASKAASVVYPFRAVLDMNGAESITAPARATLINLVDTEGMVTELDEATMQTIDQPIYTTDGRMVGKSVPATGLYIVNGKVQFIRK